MLLGKLPRTQSQKEAAPEAMALESLFRGRPLAAQERSSLIDQSGPFILHWPQVFSAGTCHGSLGELTTSASPCPLVVITRTSTQGALLAI